MSPFLQGTLMQIWKFAYITAQKMKFSIKNFFSKCDQIRRKLRTCSYLLKKSLMENFIFCAAYLFFKIICWRFQIVTPFTFWDMGMWDMRNVCLQTFRSNSICCKWAYFLRNLQTSRIYNLRILRIKNACLQDIVFIWTQTDREIFKSALVYL